MLGVKPYVLRYWEKEFAIQPEKDDKGRRVYNEDNIAMFRTIKKLRDEGFSIKAIRDKLGEDASSEYCLVPRKLLIEMKETIEKVIEILTRGEAQPG